MVGIDSLGNIAGGNSQNSAFVGIEADFPFVGRGAVHLHTVDTVQPGNDRHDMLLRIFLNLGGGNGSIQCVRNQSLVLLPGSIGREIGVTDLLRQAGIQLLDEGGYFKPHGVDILVLLDGQGDASGAFACHRPHFLDAPDGRQYPFYFGRHFLFDNPCGSPVPVEREGQLLLFERGRITDVQHGNHADADHHECHHGQNDGKLGEPLFLCACLVHKPVESGYG